MSPLDFFHPVLKALEDGKVIRKAIALALQISAVFVVVAGLYLLVEVLKFSFNIRSAEGTIGGLVFSGVLVITVACVAQILFYRAASVKALGESPFTVIPIFSILLRAVGETYATAGVAVGVGGCLFVWLAGFNPMQMLGPLGGLLPSSGTQANFLGGISFLLYLTLVSLFFLIVLYFLAESVVVLADIARNVRLLVQVPSAGGTKASPPPVPSSPRCPACGGELEEDSEFCGTCGTRVPSHSIP
jgi:hypothetical protein